MHGVTGHWEKQKKHLQAIFWTEMLHESQLSKESIIVLKI